MVTFLLICRLAFVWILSPVSEKLVLYGFVCFFLLTSRCSVCHFELKQISWGIVHSCTENLRDLHICSLHQGALLLSKCSVTFSSEAWDDSISGLIACIRQKVTEVMACFLLLCFLSLSEIVLRDISIKDRFIKHFTGKKSIFACYNHLRSMIRTDNNKTHLKSHLSLVRNIINALNNQH